MKIVITTVGTRDDLQPYIALGLGLKKKGHTVLIADAIIFHPELPLGLEFSVSPVKQQLTKLHHGGAGTTAAGWRAGKPTIIIPQNADQPAWGRKVYELRVGAKPIKRAKLSAGRLANAITYSLQPEIVANAERLGRLLIKEDGVQNAVEVIAGYLL